MENTNNSDMMSFNPENGLEEIQFMRYDYNPVSDQLESVDPFISSWLPIDDILNVNHLGPKKSIRGIIIVSAYRFNFDSESANSANIIEQSIKELQKKYPEHLIVIPQEFVYQEKSDVESFCINLDEFWFKPFPYCKFNRWIYPGYFDDNEEIEDLSAKLGEYRFCESISEIDGIISDLESSNSQYTAKFKEYRQYLFDTWF